MESSVCVERFNRSVVVFLFCFVFFFNVTATTELYTLSLHDALPIYAEGPDDMPAHIRTVLTSTSETIPIVKGRLALGTWQGIYLWEHRTRSHTREVVVHIVGS